MSDRFSCGAFVTSKIYGLGGMNPTTMSPHSRGILAQLRSATNKVPGATPQIWSVTLEGIPDDLPDWQRDRIETVAHIALTQYAMHQQGQSRPMHVDGIRLGAAVRRLTEVVSGTQEIYESPTYRHFTALTQARHISGLLAHSRNIISQLRSHEIPLDYGLYANDLYWLLTPGHASQVVRQWGRDFHRMPHAEPTTI